jgi:hypothetical protein
MLNNPVKKKDSDSPRPRGVKVWSTPMPADPGLAKTSR